MQRQLALVLGHWKRFRVVDGADTTDEMVRQVDSALLAQRVCRPDDLVVIVVAGTPPSTAWGTTNTIRVHHIGDILQRDR